MKNIVYYSVFLIFIKVAICGNSEGDNEHVIDIIGDNEADLVEPDFSDPGVLVLRPTGNPEVSKVMYGDTTLWTKTKNKHLEKVMAFKSEKEFKFVHIFYKEGPNHKGTVFTKLGDKWKATGKYDILKEKKGDRLLSMVPNIFSNFAKKLGLKSESQAEQEVANEVEEEEFDFSEDPSDLFKVKKYISVGIPTILYRPYFGKKISKVTDKYQMVWSEKGEKKPLRAIYAFNKLGFHRLLYIDTGNNPFQQGSYYENYNDEWRSMPRESFFYKLSLRVNNDVDPQFDHPDNLTLEDIKEAWRYRHSPGSSSGSSGSQKTHPTLRRTLRRTYDYESVPQKEEEEEKPTSPVSRVGSPIIRRGAPSRRSVRRTYDYENDSDKEEEEEKQSLQEKPSLQETPSFSPRITSPVLLIGSPGTSIPSEEATYMNYPIQEQTPSEAANSEKDESSLDYPLNEGDMSISWPYSGGSESTGTGEESEDSKREYKEPIYARVGRRSERIYEPINEPVESNDFSDGESEGGNPEFQPGSRDGLRLRENSLPISTGDIPRSVQSQGKEEGEAYFTPEEGDNKESSVKMTEGYRNLFLPSGSYYSPSGEGREKSQEGILTSELEAPSSLRSHLSIPQQEEGPLPSDPVDRILGGPGLARSDDLNRGKGLSPVRLPKSI